MKPMQNLELDTQVKALVAEGKMVEAIQLVMKTLGCGLKQGKDYIDNFR